jgi:hypothetical protein
MAHDIVEHTGMRAGFSAMLLKGSNLVEQMTARSRCCTFAWRVRLEIFDARCSGILGCCKVWAFQLLAMLDGKLP